MCLFSKDGGSSSHKVVVQVVCDGLDSRICLNLNPDLTVSKDVTLSKLLNLAKSQFPHLRNRYDSYTS